MELSSKDIIFDVVNTESNMERIQNSPHRDIGDISVVYKFLISTNESGRMTVPITNEISQKIGVTEEELFEIAYVNTKEISNFSIKSMRDTLISTMFPFGEEPENASMIDMMLPPDDDLDLFVMTNKEMLNGSSSILYSELLGDFADKMECDLIILPSSIHEVIIMPDKGDRDLEGIRDMVNFINMGVVDEKDRLSNNIFGFERSSRVLKPLFNDVPSIMDPGKKPTL